MGWKKPRWVPLGMKRTPGGKVQKGVRSRCLTWVDVEATRGNEHLLSECGPRGQQCVTEGSSPRKEGVQGRRWWMKWHREARAHTVAAGERTRNAFGAEKSTAWTTAWTSVWFQKVKLELNGRSHTKRQFGLRCTSVFFKLQFAIR